MVKRGKAMKPKSRYQCNLDSSETRTSSTETNTYDYLAMASSLEIYVSRTHDDDGECATPWNGHKKKDLRAHLIKEFPGVNRQAQNMAIKYAKKTGKLVKVRLGGYFPSQTQTLKNHI